MTQPLSHAFHTIYILTTMISQSPDNVLVRNTPKYFTELTNLIIFQSRDSLGLKYLQYFTPNIMPNDLLALKTILMNCM